MPADSSEQTAESLPEATALEREALPDAGRTRLLTLAHLDGRTLAARKVREAEQALLDDLGGADTASTAQRALCRRAAVLTAILEDREARWAAGEGLDVETYLAGANALRRLLATIGLERRPRDTTPDLRDYLKRSDADG